MKENEEPWLDLCQLLFPSIEEEESEQLCSIPILMSKYPPPDDVWDSSSLFQFRETSPTEFDGKLKEEVFNPDDFFEVPASPKVIVSFQPNEEEPMYEVNNRKKTTLNFQLQHGDLFPHDKKLFVKMKVFGSNELEHSEESEIHNIVDMHQNFYIHKQDFQKFSLSFKFTETFAISGYKFYRLDINFYQETTFIDEKILEPFDVWKSKKFKVRSRKREIKEILDPPDTDKSPPLKKPKIPAKKYKQITSNAFQIIKGNDQNISVSFVKGLLETDKSIKLINNSLKTQLSIENSNMSSRIYIQTQVFDIQGEEVTKQDKPITGAKNKSSFLLTKKEISFKFTRTSNGNKNPWKLRISIFKEENLNCPFFIAESVPFTIIAKITEKQNSLDLKTQ